MSGSCFVFVLVFKFSFSCVSGGAKTAILPVTSRQMVTNGWEQRRGGPQTGLSRGVIGRGHARWPTVKKKVKTRGFNSEDPVI